MKKIYIILIIIMTLFLGSMMLFHKTEGDIDLVILIAIRIAGASYLGISLYMMYKWKDLLE